MNRLTEQKKAISSIKHLFNENKHFKHVLFNNTSMNVENSGMRLINGSVVWYSTYKIGLSSKNNKRQILGFSTAPLEINDYV